MASPLLAYFECQVGSRKIIEASCAIAELAMSMDRRFPDSPEKEAGLRKLLEARDCFLRAALSAKD